MSTDNTNKFIKQQQALAKELCPNTHKEDHNQVTYIEMTEAEFCAVIAQIITNTGEELLRLVDSDEPYGGAKEIVKQHITSVTGVEDNK